MKRRLLLLAVVVLFSGREFCLAQGRQNFTLFGDVTVDELEGDERRPITMDVFLYKGGHVIGRVKIGNNGRYRFMNLVAGLYEVAIEIENVEVARVTKLIAGQYADDVRQDLHLAYRPLREKRTDKAAVVFVSDVYQRSSKNRALFEKSELEIERKKYTVAIPMLRSIVESDPADFSAWFKLGMLYYITKDFEEAEKSFLQSTKAKASYYPALFNLGRVRLARKNFAGAVDPLSEAVKLLPNTAEANYYLGQAYLRVKKGSLAVVYLNEALRLDPIGLAETHLHLAALYNAAGFKDKAAAEYEGFLKKKPDYPDRRKLEQYIAANKPASSSRKP